jgi:hypothetical protein
MNTLAIYQANSNGTGAVRIVLGDAQGDLTADFKRGKIYWFPNWATWGFMRADLNGQNSQLFTIAEQPTEGFTMNSIDGKIYFAYYDGGTGKELIKRWSEGTGTNPFITEDGPYWIPGIAFEYE